MNSTNLFKVDRNWNEYPLGTKAPAIMGGHWYKNERGWKWNGPEGSGGIFPRPGGDCTEKVILPVLHTMKPKQQVFFIDEKLPFIVQAVSERFAICTRPIHRREDATMMHFMVKTSAYCSFSEAWEANKNETVYTIVDFLDMKKAPDNYGGKFSYKKTSECEKAIKELGSEKMELSRRHGADLHVDWNRTGAGKYVPYGQGKSNSEFDQEQRGFEPK